MKNMELMKALVLNRENMATFNRAIAGVLYYNVSDGENTYEFTVDMNDKADVGTATFEANVKAVSLMRYIRKSISDGTLVKVS